MLKTFLLSWKQLRQKHEEEHDSGVRARETQTGKHKKFKVKSSAGINKKKSGRSDKKKPGSSDKKKPGSSDKKKPGSSDKQSRSVDKKKSAQNVEDVVTDMFPL